MNYTNLMALHLLNFHNDMKLIDNIRLKIGDDKLLHFLCERLHLTFMDELHLIISFLLALAIRGDIIENAWAVVPIILLFLAKELYDCFKEDATGFSLSDLRYDFIGGIVGYIIALFV